MHGKDISIPKGTEITAYVSGDMRLDIAKFQPAVPPGAVAKVATTSGPGENGAFGSAKLQLGSEPTGADIEVDGSFVGNTPSDVQIAEGEHMVLVKKAGFKDWERKLKVTAGSSVHLNADLRKSRIHSGARSVASACCARRDRRGLVSNASSLEE